MIKKNYNICPHISCINLTIKKFKYLLNFYYLNNIKKLLVLKGDNDKLNNNFYYSYNLIELIKENFKNYFNLYIAIYTEFHPNSYNYINNYKNILIKSNLNINYGITQYTYNFDSYSYFLDDIKKKKIYISVIPGIMPINSIEQLIKFSNTCKSELPLWIIKRLNLLSIKKDFIKSIGLDIIVNLCVKFINFKVKNIHFYTMNNIKIINNILYKILLNINI